METKYRASDIKIEDFIKLSESMNPRKVDIKSSYDHYYTKSESDFIRHRDGDSPQLTVKKKINEQNNFIRTEVNVDLKQKNQDETVAKFCELLGYRKNFSIYKKCWIYWFDKYNTVFYIVYKDSSMREELDRFIEIEMDEKRTWASEEEAWNLLLEVEKKLSNIGVNFRARIRKSLYEMFRK